MSVQVKVYDLYCGLGGWTKAFLAEGYECVGYDIEAHDYGSGGYPGELRIRDVRSIHGSELKDATCIVGSSPCQEFSYRAMPWKRAKALPPPYLGIELFNAQFRIQREAIEAAGHYIPMVIENVRGAQKWVGRANAHFGSFFLWGDVGMVGNRVVCVVEGKLMGGRGVCAMKSTKGNGANWNEWKNWDGTEENKPASVRPWGETPQEGYKTAGMNWSNLELRGQDFTRIAGNEAEGIKADGSGWTEKGSLKSHNRLVANTGVKQAGISGQRNNGKGDKWFQDGAAQHGSKSNARKAASAMIAKIPYPLALHIARTFKTEHSTNERKNKHEQASIIRHRDSRGTLARRQHAGQHGNGNAGTKGPLRHPRT